MVAEIGQFRPGAAADIEFAQLGQHDDDSGHDASTPYERDVIRSVTGSTHEEAFRP